MSGEVLEFPYRLRPRRSFGLKSVTGDKSRIERAAGSLDDLREALPWLLGNEDRISAAGRAAKAGYDLRAAIEDASDVADDLALKSKALADATRKMKFNHLAKEAEHLSERFALALAEFES